MNDDIISISVPPFPDFIEGNFRIFKKGESHIERTNLGYFDLIIIKKGCLFLEENDECYEIKENEMFILLPDGHHRSWKPCDEETQFYWMHFYTTAPWKQGLRAGTLESILPIPELHFHQYSSYTLHLSKHTAVNEPELLFGLCEELFNSTVRNEENSIWKTQEIFLKLLRFVENLGIHMDRKTLLAEEIRMYLEKNLAGPITNQSLSEQFHLHKNYLTRVMKSTFGKTPLELLLEMRMNYAKQYLIRTDYNLQRIAELVGFSSDIYFSNCFKKYAGISPRNYRKKYESKYERKYL